MPNGELDPYPTEPENSPVMEGGPRFSRLFFPTDVEVPLDEHGLLLDEQAEEVRLEGNAFRVDDLAKRAFVVVVGPPHAGKSHSIDELEEWLSVNGLCLRTDFRTIKALNQGLHPEGWDEWRSSTKVAVWCIDSFDEAQAADNADLALGQTLQTLSAEELSRLRLIITCRENEQRPEFVAKTSKLLGPPLEVRIAAPGRREATKICGDAEKLGEVLAIIDRESLRDLAEHPAALKHLTKKLASTTRITRAQVWRGVIEAMLEAVFAVENAPRTPIAQRFAAAARIAFILEFGDFERITVSGLSETDGAPVLEELFDGSDERLLPAAQEAIQSGLFQRIGGTIRVKHRHLREWLTAHELCKLGEDDRWEQVRSLLADSQGSLNEGARTLGQALVEVLSEQSSGNKLAKWLDANLSEYAARLLAELLDAAKDAPVSIASSDLVKRVLYLASPRALGAALSGTSTSWTGADAVQKELLLAVAQMLKSPRFVAEATAALADSSESQALRMESLTYLEMLKKPLDLLGLASSLGKQSKKERIFQAVLFRGFKSGQISVQQALGLAVEKRRPLSDLSIFLDYDVADLLNAADALVVLERLAVHGDENSRLLKRAVEVFAASPDQLRELGRVKVAIRAASAADDYAALSIWEDVMSSAPNLRRAIYEDWIRNSDTFRHDHHLRMALRVEDVPWLVTLLQGLDVPPESLVVDLWRLSRAMQADQREAVIAALSASAGAAVVADFERKEQESRRAMTERETKHSLKKPRRFSLEQALTETLAKTTDPSLRLRILGQFAFGDGPLRPTNVDGTFEGLELSLRERIFGELPSLVKIAVPSRVPEGRSIPGNILFEGAAVQYAIKHFGPSAFDGPTIRKWLPTLLRMLESNDALQACARSHPDEVVRAIAAWMQRDMRDEGGHAFAAARAPAELWSRGLAEAAAVLLRNSDLPGTGRAALLDQLSTHAQGLATSIALDWVSEANLDPSRLVAAVRVLFVVNPDLGLRALSRDVDARGRQAILDVGKALDSFAARKLPIDQWDEAHVAKFARLLHEQFPESKDAERPEGAAHWLTSEDHAIDLRERATGLLLRAGTATANSVLHDLAKCCRARCMTA